MLFAIAELLVYIVDGGASFCTFHMLHKLFDRVNYCKLLSMLSDLYILTR